ncbi:hypothetical protein Sta7437_1671 [Stanieria cyanosphaera PCC 7437]|uniref:Cyanoexosortase A system-associated protein n=1 Tax=Stanieria cyanosphaera (strain ATCC 29371 / PCC 7437) TaxID=111780 RepID=K9XRT3_STAC7|nr:hypothetical protein [Stanieria cyanosphaera]AFZ35233.1 hypothetical protein Sta7437_1671 [Stanieria cyanosphaera PCC 7437]
MNHKHWHKARLLILGCCSLSIFITLGIKLLAQSSTYTFPNKFTSDQWESITTDKIKSYGKNLQGKRYIPETSVNNLLVEVFYISNNNTSNQELIQKYLELQTVPKNLTVIENKNLGNYALFTKDKKTILTTCIHPQGKTAFTSQQFAQLANQNLKQNLLPWFLGLSDLRDWRCFWVNMSVSLENLTEEEAANILQTHLQTLVVQVIQEEK